MGRGWCIVSWWGKRGERDHWGDLGVGEWIIFGRICGMRVVYRVILVKPEGKRPLGRPRRIWVDNISVDLWEEREYRILMGKPEANGPLGRPRCRRVDNIRIDLWGDGGCIVY